MAQDLFPSPIPTATPAPVVQAPFQVAADQSVSGQQVDLLGYYRAIMRWKWAILGLTAAVTVLTFGVVSLMTPLYKAQAKLLIDTSEYKTVSIDEVYDPAASKGREFVQTQLEILKSPEVLSRVVNDLSLHKHPLFDPRQKEAGLIEGIVGKVFQNEGVGISDEQAKAVAAGVLKANLSAEPVKGSQLVAISYESADRKLSADIANALADALIDNDLDTKFQMTQRATTWMNERLSDLKTALSESEKRLQSYRDSKGLVVDNGSVIANATAQLSGTTSQLIQATAERARLQQSYTRVKQLLASGGNLADEPVVARAPAVINSKTALVNAERALSEASERYGPQHPTYQKVNAELNAARASFNREVQLAAATIQKDYETADAMVRAIQATVGAAKGAVAAVNRNEFQLASLEREVEANKQLYDLFLGRLKETNAADGLQRTIGRIVEPAVVGYQSFPKKGITVGVASVLALLLGGGIAVALMVLDNTVKTTEEVETRLRAPVLGSVPNAKAGNKGITTIKEDPQGIFAEAFRTVRTGVLLSEIDTPNLVVVVTSSVPGEGKSTVSANLAMVNSQTKKTILIDADMRRPSLGRDLVGDQGKQRKPGLSDLISGHATLEQVLIKLDGTELDFIPAGTIAPNPLDLLLSTRFKAVLEQLRQRYEVVVIDTPPVRLVSDAQVIAELATSSIYVVQADKTPYKLAQRGISEMRKANAKLIGVVLNRQDLKKADRYYGEYSGYASYGYNSYYGADQVKPAA